MKRLLTIILIAILFVIGCSNVTRFIATGKSEPKKEPITLTANQRAIDLAILKYLKDDTWTVSDMQKEIKYQQYLNRQKEKK